MRQPGAQWGRKRIVGLHRTRRLTLAAQTCLAEIATLPNRHERHRNLFSLHATIEVTRFTQQKKIREFGRREILKSNSRFFLALRMFKHLSNEPLCLQTSVDIADHAGSRSVAIRCGFRQLKTAELLAWWKDHAGAGCLQKTRWTSQWPTSIRHKKTR